MRKIIFVTISSIIVIFIGIILVLATTGIKTNNFNSLIKEKVNEINPKLKIKLNDINFKLSLTNLKFEVVTQDPTILINNKKVDLETINFDLKVFEYLNNKNPISKISIKSKENNIDQLSDFINEYNFNLSRKLILKQIRKGKIKFSTDITFDENEPNKFKYILNGSVSDTEFDLINKFKADNIKFDFIIDKDAINLREIELVLDKILISSDEININKINNKFEVKGNLKTKKTKINLNNYSKIINKDLSFLIDQPINLSSNNVLSFKVKNKFKIYDLKFLSKLNFEDLYTKSKFQDLIYLKNGEALINYDEKELKINIDSKFLFKNEEYNNNKSNNILKLFYKKKQNLDALVEIDLSNTKNKIKSKEFKKFILFKNFNLPEQNITFASENKIKFGLNKNNYIKNLNVKSKIRTDNVLINYKSQRIKKYLKNFKNQVKLTQSDFNIDYKNNNFKIDLKSKYSINDINEKITLNIEKGDNNYSFDLNIDLDSADIQIDELDYKKKKRYKI